MLEKGMSRRKMEARNEKVEMMKGSVEVIWDPTEPESMPFNRPQLDKEELLNSIIRSKGLNHESTLAEYSRYQSKDFEDDIQQIRAMARHAREIEKGESLPDSGDDDNDQAVNALPTGNMNLPKQDTVAVYESYETMESSGTKSGRVNDMNLLTDDPDHQSDQPHESRTKLRIIKSFREAREYLSRKHHKLEINREPEASSGFDSDLTMPSVDNSSCNPVQASLNSTGEVFDCSSSMTGHDYLHHHEDYKGVETNSTSHSTTAEVGCKGSMLSKEAFTQVIPGTTIEGKEDGKTTELTQT
ncbi:uncharacterized protein [Primulina huaijiensis]|uniref:uncharacterized protein n=1 Tax=Primulina huaijiensis TaxID=1492673 RepID=UPI003CC75E0C